MINHPTLECDRNTLVHIKRLQEEGLTTLTKKEDYDHVYN